MGLIKAAVGAVGGVLADQWKEFFYCDAIDKDILMVKGQKRTTSRTTNTRGNDNIISNGSAIAVADGQCMLIVEQGRVVEICAEPGEFIWDSSTEPSIFAGSFGQSLVDSFKTLGRRFTFGGDTAKDQRVYYINTKEIMDNKFGTPSPIMFRVVDSKIPLDMETEIKCNGVYSYRVADPIVFYTRICANVSEQFSRREIDQQLKTEFVDALSPAFGALSALELRPSAIPSHTKELRDSVNEQLKNLWLENRGLSVVSIAMNPVTMNEEDAAYLKELQRAAAVDSRPGMATARFMEHAGKGIEGAANNPNGAMGGFIGMGMGMNAMGGMGMQMPQMGGGYYNQQQPGPGPQNGGPTPAAPAPGAWTCPTCGTAATGKFCPQCGTAKPAAQADGWTCPTCGQVNKGKFCANCGAKKPAGEPLYRCDKCGWEPADPKNPPKFCPECGDPFNDGDIQ